MRAETGVGLPVKCPLLLAETKLARIHKFYLNFPLSNFIKIPITGSRVIHVYREQTGDAVINRHSAEGGTAPNSLCVTRIFTIKTRVSN
jgi:hypothetical protein